MANRGRHYRVAKKKIEENTKAAKGFYVSDENKQKYAIVAAIVVVATFIEGLIFGFLFGNK